LDAEPCPAIGSKFVTDLGVTNPEDALVGLEVDIGFLIRQLQSGRAAEGFDYPERFFGEYQIIPDKPAVRDCADSGQSLTLNMGEPLELTVSVQSRT
jgi:hypothetical protein